MYEINVTLKNLSKIDKELEDYADKLEKAIDDGMSEIEVVVGKKMTEYASNYVLDESNLMKTSYLDKIGNTLEIGYNAEYAGFVEYGTGIVGQENPHPKPQAVASNGKIYAEYDGGEYGDNGWFYYDENKRLHWTKGMPSRPVMYKTYLYASRALANIIGKHIGRIK